MTVKLSLEDHAAINELIALYCLHADERDFDSIAALLADAEVYVENAVMASRSAETIRARFSAFPPPASGARRHLTTNVIVRSEAPGQASSIAYFTWIETLAGAPPKILGCGVYRDRFAKQGEAWRFIERRIESDGAMRVAAKP